MNTRRLRFALFSAPLGALLAALFVPVIAQNSADLRPTAYAIRDARVVTEAGTVLPKATVVVRDGLIAAVGPDVTVPPDALVTEGKGLTVYPGFIDAGSTRGFDATLRRSLGGPPAAEDMAADPLVATKPDNRKGVTPEFATQTALKLDEEAVAPWRRVGFTAHLVAPDGGYFSGTSTLVSLSGSVPRDAILRAPVALHARFGRVVGGEYPVALMGVIAHGRQAMLDAGWLKRQWAAYEARGKTGKRPAADPCLEALWPALDGKLPVAFEADSADEIHRVLDFAAEFKLKPMIVGGRSAWKVVDRLAKEKVSVVLRLDFATAPEREADLPVRVREDRERVRKEEVACASVLHKAGVPFAFTTQGLAVNRFRENVRKVIAAGLPADVALAALTSTAADILGVAPQVGRISKGRAAHLVVCDGDFDASATKYKFAFADGVRFDLESATPPAGSGGSEPIVPKKGGRPRPMTDPDTTPAPKNPTPAPSPTPKGPAGGGGGPTADRNTPSFVADALRAIVLALGSDRATTEIEADRKPTFKTSGDVLVRGATVITGAGKTLPRADILVRGGKIRAIGTDLAAEKGVPVLDAEGMFVMAGIIDTHSHFAISGGVNEGSLSVVPEVRVRDVIDSEDVQIYRALGGGVTMARLLHGSANVIGGQDAVIKMKYGRPAREMLVADAPRGVKFALGENVKRTDGRFPNSRLGVEAVLVRAFTEAQTYRKKWADYEASKGGSDPLPEPRRDLRLEALADVLAGDLRVHSHCYRSDEILMLLRVAERFGVKIRSLQHVLEGYKVAPEIAAHGASVSLFSDWWAYKIEAFDAIPYGAKLLQDAGATVCLKSDDNELMRHLNQEAAKLVKYCGFTPEEAIHAITLNPAKQLGLDGRLGTIEVGKDADLAIFTGHPLNSYARCEMTLVEGEVYFQRSEKFAPSTSAKSVPAKTVAKFPAIPELPRGTYVLSGGTVHQPGKPAFAGTVVVDAASGRIAQVVRAGEKVDVPADARTVDCTGLHLYPGMIDAGTVLGLVEIDSARETNDSRDGGDFQPDLRASAGINPDSELIPVTRANGVTTVVTRPTGSLLPGQGALINLAGWVPAEMVVQDRLSLNIEYPSEPAPRGFGPNVAFDSGDNSAARFRRTEKLDKLKELFETARRYDAAQKAGASVTTNPRLESLLPYVRGEKPVVFTADRKADILGALKLADELKVKTIISGGTEAWKVASELKKRDVPVILGPIMSLPREIGDKYDASYAAASKLHEAGVKFCIRSAGSNNTRNLPYEAAMAVAYGLPPEAGLKAVTTGPAEILGVSDRFGTVEAGKRANLVIANGDVLQASTQVLSVFIEGRPYEPTNKQTRLFDKYQKRLNERRTSESPGASNGSP
ncbi:amidohydrolase : Amidohydrolase, imidazolonepropionase OS=Singulisphaera acidiphila (strain ATCC BAA-1392 / DSM 18658 / VKM B-2454 / MOB10) GN=Sinac_5563 PE=4 SV=1: Amidohydro_4: Amidohydro_4: Amidohydro_4 [Gemmata massiliana]|uniref:Amidohydrolase-related domain-containing protein n=1 Tax=Gemmata massiliana TaxID=1210884 RepID=A0A6P2D1G1_9BACT|nr:amidohydrolase family protein [Gemmata massiliana]VTR94697.1 amidohydrolase : Amidohydrolase, imidazolonepropionase OS=Singulisphaera acidiphila (strain ATCC BAA-1392 / DSM 18658 / VKM B-2454 / MOB10) GN=Sinac_5563 PE=4 SV=1: Amidohydro_4: Amidohydro_4: Amidohydro_4 [Gemmata massiliana]